MNILAHNLAETAYDADVAQLEYMLFPGDHGLFIRLKGFNHKLSVSCIVTLILFESPWNQSDSFEQTDSASKTSVLNPLVASEPDRRPPGQL